MAQQPPCPRTKLFPHGKALCSRKYHLPAQNGKTCIAEGPQELPQARQSCRVRTEYVPGVRGALPKHPEPAAPPWCAGSAGKVQAGMPRKYKHVLVFSCNL